MAKKEDNILPDPKQNESSLSPAQPLESSWGALPIFGVYLASLVFYLFPTPLVVVLEVE